MTQITRYAREPAIRPRHPTLGMRGRRLDDFAVAWQGALARATPSLRPPAPNLSPGRAAL